MHDPRLYTKTVLLLINIVCSVEEELRRLGLFLCTPKTLFVWV